jgi:hypothetical protein
VHGASDYDGGLRLAGEERFVHSACESCRSEAVGHWALECPVREVDGFKPYSISCFVAPMKPEILAKAVEVFDALKRA